jgi:hypothetical protein
VKKYILHILFLIISCAAFFFIYYSANNGILLFEDNRGEELSVRLQSIAASAGDEAQNILFGLRVLAEDGAIRSALEQGNQEGVLERGLLALKSLANNWPHCFSLRLINTNDQVILDTHPDTQPGAMLTEGEQVRLRTLLQRPGNFEFLSGGQAMTAIRAASDMGVLLAAFDPLFIKAHFQEGMEGVFQLSVFDGILFIVKEGILPEGESLLELASALKAASSADPAAGTARGQTKGFARENPAFTSQIMVLSEGFGSRELPVLAVQLLILSGLIFLALLLLLVLRIFHHGDAAGGASVNKKLLLNDELSQEAQATVEEIVQAADTLARQPEYTVIDEGDGAAIAVTEEMPTLQSVLERSQIKEKPPSSGREHDAELERAIHVVTDKGDAPEESAGAAGEDGADPLGAYWQGIVLALEQTFSIGDALLLADDGVGEFRVRFTKGFFGVSNFDECVISRSEKLFNEFPAKRKILYIKEGALKNKTLRSRFPGVSAPSVEQMVIVPVLRGDDVSALLIFVQPPGAPLLDQAALQEIQRLSIL